jgi:hypothetical protein
LHVVVFVVVVVVVIMVVVVVVGIVVPVVVVGSSRQPHQPGVLQVLVRVRVCEVEVLLEVLLEMLVVVISEPLLL